MWTLRIITLQFTLMAVFAIALCGNAQGEKTMSEPNVRQVYTIHRSGSSPRLDGGWEDPSWKAADTLEVKHFHKKSSDHRPGVQVRVLHDDQGLYVMFGVKDRYVVSTHTAYQDSVCQDSCAEFFVEPKADKGYFNFEVNCGGTMLLTYIETPDRQGGVGRKITPVPWEVAKSVKVFHSLPATVSPERTESVDWVVAYFVPFSLFEAYVGPLGMVTGQSWRANFYKCADASSHPHWASWAPIGEALSFHTPYYFGTVSFRP